MIFRIWFLRAGKVFTGTKGSLSAPYEDSSEFFHAVGTYCPKMTKFQLNVSKQLLILIYINTLVLMFIICLSLFHIHHLCIFVLYLYSTKYK